MKTIFGPVNQARLQVEERGEDLDERGRGCGAERTREWKVDEAPTVSGQPRIQNVEVDAFNVYHEQSGGVLRDGQEPCHLGLRNENDNLLDDLVKVLDEPDDTLHGVAKARVFEVTGRKSFNGGGRGVIPANVVPGTAKEMGQARECEAAGVNMEIQAIVVSTEAQSRENRREEARSRPVDPMSTE
jgi:hypothetical protein